MNNKLSTSVAKKEFEKATEYANKSESFSEKKYFSEKFSEKIFFFTNFFFQNHEIARNSRI